MTRLSPNSDNDNRLQRESGPARNAPVLSGTEIGGARPVPLSRNRVDAEIAIGRTIIETVWTWIEGVRMRLHLQDDDLLPHVHCSVQRLTQQAKHPAPVRKPIFEAPREAANSKRLLYAFGARSTVANLPSSEYADPRPGQTPVHYSKQGSVCARSPGPRSGCPADQSASRLVRASL